MSGGRDREVGLRGRLADRRATVAVIGLGYIGLPAAAAAVDAGFNVLGVDIDRRKVELLERGEAYLRHLGAELPRRLLATGRFAATADLTRLGEADVTLACVPTPLDGRNAPDLQYVTGTMRAVSAQLRPGQLVVLESTTYPGTTRDVVRPILDAAGLVLGVDWFLAYSPEREDPGRTDWTTRTIPRLVGALDPASQRVAEGFYGAVVDTVVPVSSAEVAEAAKLLENIYRAVNIAMVNEMKVMLTGMQIDVHEVVDAAATKPFGFQSFRPGPGLGGHCLPIDPFYLAHKAREIGLPTRFIELAGEVNRRMPGYVVDRTLAALRARDLEPALARVLVLGLAYKADVDDVRESPSFVILEQLARAGVHVDYHDPHVPVSRPVRHADVPPMESVALTAEALAGYDAVVLATDHADVDYDLVGRSARLVVDTRGVLRGPVDAEVVVA